MLMLMCKWTCTRRVFDCPDFASPSLFMALLYTADVVLLPIISPQMVSYTLCPLVYSTFTIWCTSLAGRTGYRVWLYAVLTQGTV